MLDRSLYCDDPLETTKQLACHNRNALIIDLYISICFHSKYHTVRLLNDILDIVLLLSQSSIVYFHFFYWGWFICIRHKFLRWTLYLFSVSVIIYNEYIAWPVQLITLKINIQNKRKDHDHVRQYTKFIWKFGLMWKVENLCQPFASAPRSLCVVPLLHYIWLYVPLDERSFKTFSTESNRWLITCKWKYTLIDLYVLVISEQSTLFIFTQGWLWKTPWFWYLFRAVMG